MSKNEEKRKITSRQVGRLPSGKLITGTVAKPSPNKSPKSSIPSKFETIIYTDAQERLGFSSGAHRFPSTENELPGPGAYNNVSPSIIKNTASMSRRGYGKMISKDKRWYNAPPSTFNPPGPGSYNISDCFSSRLKPVNKAHGTPQFALPSSSSLLGKKKPTPGPGQYDIDKKPKNLKPSAAFKSGTKRPFQIVVKEQPVKKKQGREGREIVKKKLPMAVFRSTVKRESYLISNKSNNPGPGEYDVKIPNFVTDDSPRPSHPFASTTDRYGKPINKRLQRSHSTPGPGAYFKMSKTEKLKIHSSFFMSQKPRFDYIVPANNNLGPCYDPEKIGKKSFHYNATARWM